MHTQTKTKARLISLLILVGILVLWEINSRSGVISATFFPAPSKIFAAFNNLVKKGDMQSAFFATMIRFVVGALCGSLLGAVLGLMMGWWQKVNYYLSPWIAALYPIPKIAIFPLLMIVFGIGEGSKFVAILLSSFFPMLITTLAGVQQISRTYFEVAQNYGVRGSKMFTRILLPGSLPSILAGLRLAVNSAFVIAISVEVISATSGLGVLLWFGWQTFRVSELYAVLLVISVVGVTINYLLELATKKLVPWMGEAS